MPARRRPRQRAKPIVIGPSTAIVVVALLQRVVAPAFDQLERLDATGSTRTITLGLTVDRRGRGLRAHGGGRQVPPRPAAANDPAADEVPDGPPHPPPRPPVRRGHLRRRRGDHASGRRRPTVVPRSTHGISRRGVAIVAWLRRRVLLVASCRTWSGPVVSRILGHGRDLPAAGARPEHRGGLRGPARPRVRGVLRRRRLLHRDPDGRSARDVRGVPAPDLRTRASRSTLALPIVVAIAALIGRADRRAGAAAPRRLPGDRDAGLRRDRARDLRLDLGAEPVRRLARHERHHDGGDPRGRRCTSRPTRGTSTSWSWSSACWRCSSRGGLQGSRVGRAWNAMREDEQVADAMGISTTRFKLLAFAMGGAIGSVGRRAVRREPRLAHDRELPDPRVDHGARGDHPRRSRIDPRSRSWARSS